MFTMRVFNFIFILVIRYPATFNFYCSFTLNYSQRVTYCICHSNVCSCWVGRGIGECSRIGSIPSGSRLHRHPMRRDRGRRLPGCAPHRGSCRSRSWWSHWCAQSAHRLCWSCASRCSCRRSSLCDLSPGLVVGDYHHHDDDVDHLQQGHSFIKRASSDIHCSQVRKDSVGHIQ